MAATHGGTPELKPLVYPVAQLLQGAARLVPTPRYFPLRLRLVRAINRCARGPPPAHAPSAAASLSSS